MMKEISSYRKGKAGMDAGGEEMDETDPLVKDTGGQEVQRKVLRFPGYRGKGVSERHLFFCHRQKLNKFRC